MSTFLFVLAGFAALLMAYFGLVGCSEMMLPREAAKSKRQEAFRLFDVIVLRGAVWSVQSFRQNWRAKHHARKMLYWSFGFLFISLLLCGVTILVEIFT